MSLMLAGVSVYAARDGAVHTVVNELERFHETFDSVAVSKALTEAAQAQGQVPVSNIGQYMAAPGVPKMQFAPAAVVMPRGSVQVRTLADAMQFRASANTSIGIVDAEALGHALSFRLARAAEAGPLLLQSVELQPTHLTEADAQLLLDAEAARQTSVSTRNTLTAAQAEQERLEALYEQRAKWHAPVKVLQKTGEQRAEARTARSEAQTAWEAASAKYQEAARAALAIKAEASQEGPLSMALAVVTLARVEGKPPLTLRLPTKLKEIPVPLPALSGIDFTQTEKAGLWQAVQGLTPDAALKRAQQEFTFFSQGVALGTFQLTGSVILQLVALCLPLLLWMIVSRSRSAARGYDPFARQEALPQVGLRSEVLNLLLTSILPAVAAALSSVVLWRLGQWPVVAAPSSIAAALYGLRAKTKLHDLRDLKAAVIRSVSTPPNAPLSITPLPPGSELSDNSRRGK